MKAHDWQPALLRLVLTAAESVCNSAETETLPSTLLTCGLTANDHRIARLLLILEYHRMKLFRLHWQEA